MRDWLERLARGQPAVLDCGRDADQHAFEIRTVLEPLIHRPSMSELADNPVTKAWLKHPGFWLWLCFISLVIVPLFAVLGWHYYLGKQVVGRKHVGVTFTNDGLLTRYSRLRPFARIRSVKFRAEADVDDVVPWLRFQPELKELWLDYDLGSPCTWSRQTFSQIADSCPQLELLLICNHQLPSFSLSEDDCEQIARLSNLKKLTVIANIDGDGLARLARLSHLKEFEYFPKARGKSTPFPVTGLGSFESVESLRLNLTDGELQAMLADRPDGRPVLPRLKSLSLTEWGHYGMREDELSNATMKLLAKQSELEVLSLMDIRVSIQGVRSLIGLTHLRSLTIGERGCSQTEIDTLPMSFLSRCKIRRENDNY